MTRRFRPLLVASLAVTLLGLADHRPAVQAAGEVLWADPARMLETVRHFSENEIGEPKTRYAYRVEMNTHVAELRDRLAAALGARGTAELWHFPAKQPPGTWDPAELVPLRLTFANVIGRLPGSRPGQGKFVVTSHFDATGSRTPDWRGWADPAPGADDNLSGTAAVVEIARILAQEAPLPFDVEFVAFDGEELGLWGSDTLAAAEKAAGQPILGVLNMDMIGYNPRTDSLAIMTNRSSHYLADYVRESEALDPQDGLDVALTIDNLVNSDHGPYWENGYAGFMMIENLRIVRHNPQYHQLTDRVGTISRDGSQMARGANVLLKTLRRLAADAEGPPKLRISGTDLVVTVRGSVESRVAMPGDTIFVGGGVFNAGGLLADGSTVDVRFYRIRDGERQLLEQTTLDGELGPGAHVRVPVAVPTTARDAGAVTVEMEIDDGTGVQTARRAIPVRGDVAQVAEHYMTPNPVRELSRAHLNWTLTREASVRVTLFDLHGDELGRSYFRYSDATSEPAPGTTTGLQRVPLTELLAGEEPAPGVYLYRIEVFAEGDPDGLATVGKFAILR
jgi:hypothetical protein